LPTSVSAEAFLAEVLGAEDGGDTGEGATVGRRKAGRVESVRELLDDL
jgi:hypothetical protein